MDVARAVREDALNVHSDQRLATREFAEQRVVGSDRCRTTDPHPVGAFEVDEEQANLRVGEDIAETLEHAVAVVIRKGERPIIEYPDESGHTALVRNIWLAVCIGGRQEEHRTA